MVRQAELQPKPEVIESSLTKYSELDYDYCVSRDTQWYARYPYRNGSLSVMRSDHSTTHTLAAGNGQIFVASRFGVIPPGITVSEDLALGPISHVLNISPDGRWMAFIRQTRKNKEELLSNSTESVVEFGLLDLNSGTVAIVDRREVLAASNQDYFSMLPFAWSPRGTLAVVFADQVMLFKPDSATGEINARRIIEVKPIAEAETKLRERGIGTGFRNLAFWDETTLLYWNFQSLWRIDLAESSNGN
ncbi:hypothetical protein HY256_06650 [Candidatus Sumerlaeota bacterium]|nr:hypothetical protein [Candidatus Sumerlaeota bacterium]